MKNTDDAEEVIKAIQSGQNIYLSGSAGAGKSYLVKQFAKKSRSTVLTATTGIAALNIGGETTQRICAAFRLLCPK